MLTFSQVTNGTVCCRLRPLLLRTALLTACLLGIVVNSPAGTALPGVSHAVALLESILSLASAN